jgi:LacI family transcriptional regulator
MRDVAELAGVSIQTVSLVVHGKSQIGEATRARVQSAITQLDYIPHVAAQTLRSGHSGNIGLLIPDAHNPHFWNYVRGVEEVAVQHNYSVLLTISNLDPDCERRALRSLIEQRVDGLALMLSYPELFRAELQALHRRGKPVVGDLESYGYDAVHVPYDRIAREMMAHLLDFGHHRIGLIHSVGRAEHASERVAAYRECLSEAGVAVDERLIVRCRPIFSEAFLAAQRLLDLRPRPTAILGICDLAAFSAMQAALQRGLRIPHDVSIAGFDDIEIAPLLTPGLTTARAHSLEAGRMLARLLLDRIAQPDLPPRRVEMPAQLVIRGSTGPCPEPSRSQATGSARGQRERETVTQPNP